MSAGIRYRFFLAWLLYSVWVIYGNWVPLQYTPIPLDEALARFARVPFFHLGAESRADWIANGLLFIPISYLMAAALAPRNLFGRALVAVFAAGFHAVLAVLLEFSQLYFPPRTVSLNDIYSEMIGAALGGILFLLAHDRLLRLGRRLGADRGGAVKAALVFYAAGYFAYSFFPYDFVLNRREWIQKLAAGGGFNWIADVSYYAPVQFWLATAAAVVTAAPLGALYVLGRKTTAPFSWPRCLTVALGLGLVIEAAQMLLVSGLSQGLSAATRSGGFLAGCMLARRLGPFPVLFRALEQRSLIAAVAVCYALAVVLINWFQRGPILSLSAGLNRVASLSFVPFFYHYYLPESQALWSLLAYAGTYFPLGALFRLWTQAPPITGAADPAPIRQGIPPEPLRGPVLAILLGGLIAAVMEAGKLFLAQARPDPTNTWIGAGAAGCGYLAACWLQRLAHGETGKEDRTTEAQRAPRKSLF